MYSLAEAQLLTQTMGYGIGPSDLRTTNADKSFDCYCYFAKPNTTPNYLEDQLAYLLSRGEKAGNRRVGYLIESISADDSSIRELNLLLIQYEEIDKEMQASLLAAMPTVAEASPTLVSMHQATLKTLYRKVTVSIVILPFKILENDNFKLLPCSIESAKTKIDTIMAGVHKCLTEMAGRTEVVQKLVLPPTIFFAERMRQLFEKGTFENFDPNSVKIRYAEMLVGKILEKFDELGAQSPEDYHRIYDRLKQCLALERLLLLERDIPSARSFDQLVALKRCHIINKSTSPKFPDQITIELIRKIDISTLLKLLGCKNSAALTDYLSQEIPRLEQDMADTEKELDVLIDAKKPIRLSKTELSDDDEFQDEESLEGIEQSPITHVIAQWLQDLRVSSKERSNEITYRIYEPKPLDADLFLRDQLQYVLRNKLATKNRRVIFFLEMPRESPFVSTMLSCDVREENFVAVFVDCEGVNQGALKWLLASLGNATEIDRELIANNLSGLRTIYEKVTVKLVPARVQTSAAGNAILFPSPDLFQRQTAYLAPFVISSYDRVQLGYAQPNIQPQLSPYIFLCESMCQLIATGTFGSIDVQSIQLKYSCLLGKQLASRIGLHMPALRGACLELNKVAMHCSLLYQLVRRNEMITQAVYDGLKQHLEEIPRDLVKVCQTFAINFLSTALQCQTPTQLLTCFKNQQEILSAKIEELEEKMPIDNQKTMTFGGHS